MKTKPSKLKMKADITFEISCFLSMNFIWLITYSIYSCHIQRDEILLAKFRSFSLVDRSNLTLQQVCGKLPFDKNPSAKRMLKSHMNYYRTCINDDGPEKNSSKSITEGK